MLQEYIHLAKPTLNIKREFSEQIHNMYYAVYSLIHKKIPTNNITRKEFLFYQDCWENQQNQVMRIDSMTNAHLKNAIEYAIDRIAYKDMRQFTMYDWTLSFLVLFNEAVSRNNLELHIFSQKNLEDIYMRLDEILNHSEPTYSDELLEII